MSLPAGWIVPDWSAPLRVRAFSTTRAGGVSEGEYASLNLGLSSGDDPARVAANRAIVRLHLPGDPAWLRQVHGTLADAHGLFHRAQIGVTAGFGIRRFITQMAQAGDAG